MNVFSSFWEEYQTKSLVGTLIAIITKQLLPDFNYVVINLTSKENVIDMDFPNYDFFFN